MFKYYCTKYESPSNMYGKLSNPESTATKFQVNSVKKTLAKLKRETENTPKNEIYKIEENNKIIDIVEPILYLDAEIQQQGQGLKILTPNQMLSRLPISLAQLKAGNNSEKLKNEIRQLLYSLHRSKNLQKIFIKV